MKFSLFIFLIFYFHTVFAQEQSSAARFFSLGTASVALTNTWSAQDNQAGLADIKQISFSVSHQNKYSLKELNQQLLILTVPFHQQTFALSFSQFGYERYKEQHYGISYAKKISPKLNVGIRLNLHHLYIAEYGKASAATLEGGIQYTVSKRAVLASHLSNPNRSAFHPEFSYMLPVRIRTGISYSFSGKVMTCVEIEKESEYQPDYKAGLEYNYSKYLYLRCGFSFREIKNHFGLGIHYQNFIIDLAAATHPVLGFSSVISLSYEL